MRPPILLLLCLAACDATSVESKAQQAASAAENEARKVGDAAEQKAQEAVAQASDAAEETLHEAVGRVRDELRAQLAAGDERAAAYVDGKVREWLGVPAADSTSLEARAVRGDRSAQEVAGLAKALAEAVDTETLVLPIHRRVDSGQQADIDAAIEDMPRTEVIDGLTVGFKQLRRTDTHKHLTEDGYLVLWRRDDHLVGFVYRSRRRIDLDVVVRKTPALMAATQRALSG